MKTSLIFSRRIFFLLALKTVMFLVLISRLFYLQIKENYYFDKLSENNRTNLVPIIPKRGLILDKLDNKIADNVFLWEALFFKSQINQKIELFVNNVQSVIYISDADRERIIKDYKSKPTYYPILIKQNLSPSEIAALETFSYNLVGTFIRPFYRRDYPFKDAFAHLVGYTSITDDISKSNNVSNWYTGRSGVELLMDSFLRGEVGYLKYEINAYGEIVRKLEQVQSKTGYNISLTVESTLQNSIQSLLQQFNSASATVIEIDTGNILSLASYPSFDPNLFSFGIPRDIWQDLINSEKAPLSNKPLQGLYPPGSTIKPILILEALEKGIISANTKVECKGYIDIGKERFHCWKPNGHGIVDTKTAVVQSCDIFFYEMSRNMQLSDINRAGLNFGFSSRKLPMFPVEAKGRTVLKDGESNNNLGDRINSSIGQGKWLTTPIQLANMVGALANNGKTNGLNLIKSVEYEDKIIYPKNSVANQRINYSADNYEIMKSAMYDVVNAKNGTAPLAKTGLVDWPLSGKTGTAQVRRISLEERNTTGVIANHLLPWNRRDHALFVGFVPYNKPLYAISVVVEHGGGGSVTAAPLAREIALLLRQQHTLYEKENERLKSILES